MEQKKNISSRQKVQILLSRTNGLVTLDNVQEFLNLSRTEATHLLYRLSRDGWVKKLKNGLYRIVSLESSDPSLTDENPWVVANQLFSPCYIGLWTAANFWGLTDQLFIDTWVLTSQKIFKNKKSVSDHQYTLRHIDQSCFFGLKTEWIENNKILISDFHKTALDFLNFPDIFTSQSIIDVFQAYFSSNSKNIDILSEYAKNIKNRTILKRLGFILEMLSPESSDLIQFCFENKSKGVSPLSTISPCDTIITRWNLKVPKKFKDKKND